MKIIDLTVKRPGCTGHPVVRLNRVLRELKDRRAIIRVKTSDIPVKVLERLVLKKGYKIIKIAVEGICVEVEIEKIDTAL
ncbi:MAG: hypothetical protein DRJ52_08885 [Thermoprotei archaeon]|nr:MAG: hypothetical protein DRJ52_08885 [Thermoprotei archaeon]